MARHQLKMEDTWTLRGWILDNLDLIQGLTYTEGAERAERALEIPITAANMSGMRRRLGLQQSWKTSRSPRKKKEPELVSGQDPLLFSGLEKKIRELERFQSKETAETTAYLTLIGKSIHFMLQALIDAKLLEERNFELNKGNLALLNKEFGVDLAKGLVQMQQTHQLRVLKTKGGSVLIEQELIDTKAPTGRAKSPQLKLPVDVRAPKPGVH